MGVGAARRQVTEIIRVNLRPGRPRVGPVFDSDAMLWFGAANTPGARAMIEACRQLSRSCLRVVAWIGRSRLLP